MLRDRKNRGRQGAAVIHLKADKGSILVLVSVTMLLLCILGTTLVSVGTAEVREAVRQERQTQAFLLARSGADSMAAWIIESANAESDFLDEILKGIPSEPEPLGEGTVTLQVSGTRGEDITILATGNVKGVEQVVTLILSPRTGEAGSGGSETTETDGPLSIALDMAVFSDTGIILSGSAQIFGNAGTNATAAGAVSFGSATAVNGNLYIGQDGDSDLVVTYPGSSSLGRHVTGNVTPLQQARQYPLPPYPELPLDLAYHGNFGAGWWPPPPHHINEDGEYGNLDVDSTLVIDVGEGVRRLRVRSLKVTGNGEIILTGTGALHLHVEDTLVLGNSGRINEGGHPGRVLVYYSGASALDYSGNTRLAGCVYIERANIIIGASGGIIGHIVTGGDTVTISGDASANVRAVYAPNAHVFMGGSGKVAGAIVADSFKAEGGTTVTYCSDLDPIPFLAVDNGDGDEGDDETGDGAGENGGEGSAGYERILWQ